MRISSLRRHALVLSTCVLVGATVAPPLSWPARAQQSIDARSRIKEPSPGTEKLKPYAKDQPTRPARKRNFDGTVDRIPTEGGICEVAPPCPSWCEQDFRSNSCLERQPIKTP